MRLFLFITFVLLAQTTFGQTSNDSIEVLVPDTFGLDYETYETDDVFYNYTNAILLNKKKVFKAIYKKAKKLQLLTGEKVNVNVLVDDKGALLSIEFYRQDSAYTFIRKIFRAKAKYAPAFSAEGTSFTQAFAEPVILSKDFLLGGYEYKTDFSSMYAMGDKITGFDKEYYIRVKVTEIVHNGNSEKVSIDIKKKITNYQSPQIELSENVAVYFEFPQVTFKTEKYFLCNYYIKEKVGGLWNIRCSGVLNDIKYYNKSFVSGITCGANDDPMRLELKLDVLLEIGK